MKNPKPDDRAHGREWPILGPTAATWHLAAGGAVLLWLAQPPLGLWPLAWVALVPWLLLVLRASLGRRQYGVLYFVAVAYWALTMQGIRHAHPAMFIPWGALAAYLAVYPAAWVALVRVASAPRNHAAVSLAKSHFRLPIWVSAPVVWVGLECVRNYFLTGISAVMLGHSQADVPAVIQIADAWGTYGVSFVIVLVNAAIAAAVAAGMKTRRPATAAANAEHSIATARSWILSPWLGGLAATVTLMATLAYGYWRLAEAEALVQPAAINIALIGRDEPIIFEQDADRELRIFDAYLRQSHQAAQQAAERNLVLHAVVWPESMFTGALPWLALDPSRPLAIPAELEMSESEFREIIADRQQQFQRRASQVQSALRQASGQISGPELIVGCSVVSYNQPPGGYSGCVHIDADGRVANWYAKMHLVMFGEYIPWIHYLPWIDYVVPPGMGILAGEDPVPMPVGGLIISPNVCIETAVERVPVNQVSELIARGAAPDLIINVTNDGWFNRTSIVEHHLRCSQLVAVACRRPVLISANGGPTAWIDGSGRTVQRLRNEDSGAILLSSQLDGRNGLYLRIGDWPARMMALACGILALVGVMRRRAGCQSSHHAPP